MHFWVTQLTVTPGLVVLAWFERQDGGGPAGGEQGGTGCVCPRAVRADAVRSWPSHGACLCGEPGRGLLQDTN